MATSVFFFFFFVGKLCTLIEKGEHVWALVSNPMNRVKSS